MKRNKVCKVEDCTAKHYSKGWCSKHYNRWLRHGDVSVKLPVFSRGYQSIETRRKISQTMKGIPKSEEMKQKLHLHHTSSKSHLWKGGKTIDQTPRMSYEYMRWRLAVYKRDNFTCVLCGYISKNVRPADINADHIKSFANYPEHRFDISNGRTLCIPCHRKTDSYGRKQLIVEDA